MIKLVASAVWICVVTLASVYFSLQAQSTTPTEIEANEFFGGLDYVRGEVMSVPVISGGEVQGYFLTRLVFTAEPEKLGTLSIDPQYLISDELYSHLVGNETIDFTDLETFDIAGFRDGIKQSLNARVGEELFKDVIIEQIDFLSKAEIRANMQRRRSAVPKGPPPEEEAAAAAH